MSELDNEAAVYAEAVDRELNEILAPDLVGVYLHGSVALGDFVPSRSDVDIVAVCAQLLSHDTKRLIAEHLATTALPCPAVGLELHVVRCDTLLPLTDSPPFELHIATGTGTEPDRVVDGIARFGDPDLVMHYAVLRDRGNALTGPSPANLFPAVPRGMVLQALATELRWARESGSGSYQVLNACRAWRFVEEGVLCSKLDGARWASQRVGDTAAIDIAVRHRQGGSEIQPDIAAASCLLDSVLRLVEP